MIILNTIQKILYLLKENNLNADKLAKSLKVSNSLISLWKKGKSDSYLNHIDKIASILNVTPEYLLDENEPIVNTNTTPTQRLFNLISEKNITQKTLADKIKVPLSTVNQWFKFNRKIPQNHIVSICEFLKIDVNWLLTGDNIDKTNNTDCENNNIKDNSIEDRENTSNRTDENIILEIYRNLTEGEKHEFMEFAYRMKFYHDENLPKEEIQDKLEASNSIDNADFSKIELNKII